MSEGLIHVSETGGMNLDRANKVLAGLGDGKQLRNALYNAISRAGKSAKSDAGRFAANEYSITKATFNSNVRTFYHINYNGGKLSGGVVSCEVSFAGNVIPLIQFNTKFSRDGGVRTTVKRGSGGTLEHAFIASIGGYDVYERLTTKRFPLEKKYGPSAAHMMMNETVEERMDHRS